MSHVEIKVGAVGDPVLFPDLRPTCRGKIEKVGILQAGMKSGKTSVALNVETDDGGLVFVEMSASMFLSIAGAVRGAAQRFGDE